jgi:hypothetical protein
MRRTLKKPARVTISTVATYRVSPPAGDEFAHVVEANIRARYAMTSRVALITGVNCRSADVEIKRPNSIGDIRYGYDGAYVDLDFNF